MGLRASRLRSGKGHLHHYLAFTARSRKLGTLFMSLHWSSHAAKAVAWVRRRFKSEPGTAFFKDRQQEQDGDTRLDAGKIAIEGSQMCVRGLLGTATHFGACSPP